MITEEDIKKKTPALEQFLVDIAREVGAKEAVLFDGTVINLVNKEEEPKHTYYGGLGFDGPVTRRSDEPVINLVNSENTDG